MCNNITHTNWYKATTFVFMLSFHGSENQTDTEIMTRLCYVYFWRLISEDKRFGVT